MTAAARLRCLHAALLDQPLSEKQEAWFTLWAALGLDVLMESPEARQEHLRALLALSDGLRD
jgi:hypothetical protein